MSLEQELKLVVNSDNKVDLRSLVWPNNIHCSEREEIRLISVYYDTSDLHLLKQGLGLRLRKSGDNWLQTVKTSGIVKNGLHQRDEWEHELEDKQWDLDKLKQTPIATTINDAQQWANIKPLFTTDFVRQILLISVPDGSTVELAYDRGHVTASEKKANIHEIELELKSGNVNSLHMLATHLFAQLDVAASDCSKAKQGYELASK